MILATGEKKSGWPLGETKLIKVLIYISSLNGQKYLGPYLNIEAEKHQIKILREFYRQAGLVGGLKSMDWGVV